jgi:nucleotide-binding universal stress UspA family protein
LVLTKLKNLTGGPKMKETKRIVVPVDFSEITNKLVDYAVYMANKLAAEIHFLHAVHFYAGDSMVGFPYAQECEAKLITDAEERMSNILADNKERCPTCTGKVVIGDPVEKIVEFAQAKESDLIIISTHGVKGLEKILLGSVAERVLKRAHCPVLFLNPFKNNER